MSAWIYKITNLTNNKIYIGQTVDMSDRKYQHRNIINRKKKKYSYIENAFLKYGKDNFKFETIVKIKGIKNTKYINDLESHFVHLYQSNRRNIGYNLTKGGDYYSTESTRKEVHQYSLEGNYINSFKSGKEASIELNLQKVSISACCHNKVHKTGIYRFSFQKVDKLPPLENDNLVPVKIKFLESGIIKEYKSQLEFLKEFGYHKDYISKILSEYKFNKRKDLKLGFKLHKKYEIIP